MPIKNTFNDIYVKNKFSHVYYFDSLTNQIIRRKRNLGGKYKNDIV